MRSNCGQNSAVERSLPEKPWFGEMATTKHQRLHRGIHSLIGVLLVFMLGVLAVSCSVLIDADRVQCSTTADCSRHGAAFANAVCLDAFCEANPAWSCLDSEGALRASSTSSPSYDLQLTLLELVSHEPLVGVSALLCRKLDVDCMAPLGPASASGRDGKLGFSVPAGFDGYVLLRDKQIMPTLFFFGAKVSHSEQLPPVPLPSSAVVASLTQQTGTPIESGHGLIVVQTNDCERRLSAGVSVSTEDGDEFTRPFYWIGGLPTTGAKTTDGAGFAGLVNAPEGAVAVTGTLAEGGRKLTTTGLLVRSGYLTFVRMVPLGS